MNLDDLKLPSSKGEIEQRQSEGKRRALAQARQAGFWQGKLDHIDDGKLDDPSEWQKIPVLTKDELRQMSTADFYRDFNLAPRRDVAEYWRSGGSTGKPLFYPRTHRDIEFALIGFRRALACAGVTAEDIAHISLPFGIHPAGHLMARAAEQEGAGVIWAGAGNALPSEIQLGFLEMFRPTVWIGMSSYGIHLGNLAASKGINPAELGIEKVLCTAEPVSQAKRHKIETQWGAELTDMFGMTETMMMGAEDIAHNGFRIWSDMNFLEVLDPETLAPVAVGEEGVLVMTPLATNEATPFLRWNTDDIVTLIESDPDDSPFSVFPIVKHAHRTAGFFKVRGVNIGHSDFEDLMFGLASVNDFRVEAVETDGLDELRVYVEVGRGSPMDVRVLVLQAVKKRFEVTPKIILTEKGTIAQKFSDAIKPNRFADLRN